MDKRCAASGEKYTSYSTAKRKRPDGMIECPVCGKVVKLRKQGLDRWPTTLPYHDDNRGLSTAKGSNYPLLPGRQLGKRLVPVGAPQPPSASGERAYPAVTYAKAFQFLGSLANPLFETGFVGDDAHSSEIPNPRLVRLIQAMIDEDRAALAPSPGIDAAEQKPVAWLIDWPDEPDLGHYFAEEPSPTARSRALVLADVAPPAAQPSTDDAQFPFYELRFIMRVLGHEGSAPKEDWQTAYGMARDIFVRWSKERQAAEPHPPSRACMCDACKPSFENGADDPAQRHDIVRQVPGPSAEWLAEAERLIDSYAESFSKPTDSGKCRQRLAALLAHLRSAHATT